MEQGVVAETFFAAEIDALKDLQKLFLVKEADQCLLCALLWDVKDPIGPFTLFGVHEADHPGKGFKGRQAMITGPGEVFALSFEIVEKGQD